VFAAVALSVLVLKKPTWELRDVVLDHVHIPIVAQRGVSLADNSGCPMEDPCGLTSGKGCSKCQNPTDVNKGCLCEKGTANTSSGSAAGSVVPANTSACPLWDPCGALWRKGCSRCSDSSWINEGCTCRQPMSSDQFFGRLHGIIGSIVGSISSLGKNPVSFKLRATAVLKNQNMISAATQPTHVNILYKDTVLGKAHINALDVAPWSEQLIPVNVTVTNVTTVQGVRMVQDLLAGAGLLSLSADGDVVAKVFWMQVTTNIHCDVTANVLEKGKIVSKTCKYTPK